MSRSKRRQTRTHFARAVLALSALGPSCHEGALFNLHQRGEGGDAGSPGESATASGGRRDETLKTSGGSGEYGGGTAGWAGQPVEGGAAASGGTQENPHGSALVPRSVGRLPFEPSFCWVWREGTLDSNTWNEQRLLYETTIRSWQAASGLTIVWLGICEDAASGDAADVRILLDHRNVRGKRIDGCLQSDTPGPWAVFPEDAPSFSDCAWNMVLPSSLEGASPVLHTAGHALGFSHWHVDREGESFDPETGCPNLPRESSNPYLSTYDAASAMHTGASEAAAFMGNPWLSCDGEPTDEASSRGDVRDSLSPGDVLGVEMIYPASLDRSLGATGWLYVNGIPTFRSDALIRLESDWAHQGANPDWFLDPSWTNIDGTGIQTQSSGLAKMVAPEAAPQMVVSHSFRDPFGQVHKLSSEINASDSLHTAVLLAVSLD